VLHSHQGRFKKGKQLFRPIAEGLFKNNPPQKIDIGAFINIF